MFTDPQSITISGTAVSLPRISMGDGSGKFRAADGSLELSIQHLASNRERSVIRLDRFKVGADPLNAQQMKNYKFSTYVVVDAPLNGVGFTDAEQEADIKGLIALLNTSGVLAKFLGKEA